MSRAPFFFEQVVLVLLSFSTSALSLADNTDTNDHRVHLEITTYLGDRQTFVAGDRLSFLVTLDRDAYLLVLYETAEHQVIQLLPHRYSPARKYPAGYYLAVPDETARYEFRIAPPFGKERILAFASEKPFLQLPGKDLDNGLRLLTDKTSNVLQQLRGSKVNEGYGEADLELTTRAPPR